MTHPAAGGALRIHLPTAELLAEAIRGSAGGNFYGPTWQVRAFREGMRTAAEVVDSLIAEAKRNGG